MKLKRFKFKKVVCVTLIACVVIGYLSVGGHASVLANFPGLTW
ncbi:hypothetical protein [Clostridium felsineum]|uniref:Uncharacterized protein n=1 Tax=Clostridium felsineum TaxID=36839 RepID=A0A1S8L5W0_9CLOT|nr:hypothetical protein [Clostridium felsineum]URZ08646.1 hypothetical protein CLROS_040280 [Clostridium felsineum]URZ13676.1 hypothetical protein CROST_044420 [Clostridium felsineum]